MQPLLKPLNRLTGGVVRLLLFLTCFLLPRSLWAEAGFHSDSEVGIVVTNGNSKSQSYNLKQGSAYGWEQNEVKFGAHYLNVSSLGVTSAENWSFVLRYDRVLSPMLSVFVAQSAAGDRFAGYNQKYGSDIGAKHQIVKEEAFSWFAEAGYRYSVEHRTDRSTYTQHLGRLFTEAVKNISVTSSGKLWLEYLPDLKKSKDFQINSEASLSSILTDILSIKIAYLLKFDNVPASKTAVKTDTVFTTNLVAKF